MSSSSDFKKEMGFNLCLIEENHMYRRLQLFMLLSITVLAITFYMILFTTPSFAVDNLHYPLKSKNSKMMREENQFLTPIFNNNSSNTKEKSMQSVGHSKRAQKKKKTPGLYLKAVEELVISFNNFHIFRYTKQRRENQ